MRTVTTVEELEELPIYTVVKGSGCTYVRLMNLQAGRVWQRVTYELGLSSRELLVCNPGPFEVVASPQNETIAHHLREARDERDRAIAENERLKAENAELGARIWALGFGNDRLGKRVDELEAGQDVEKVANWSRRDWLDFAGGVVLRGGDQGVAGNALRIAEQMREADA